MTQSRVSSDGAATDLVFPANIWLSAGVFGIVAGVLVLLLNDSLSDRVVWLAENYRSQAALLQENQVQDVSHGERGYPPRPRQRPGRLLGLWPLFR